MAGLDKARLAYEHRAPDDSGKLLIEVMGNGDIYLTVDNRNIKVRIRHLMTMENFDEMYDEVHRTMREGALDGIR